MSKLFIILLLTLLHLSAYDKSLPNQISINYFHDYNKSFSITEVIKNNQIIFNKSLLSNDAKFSRNAQIWLKVKQINPTNREYNTVLKFLDIRLDKMSIYSKESQLLGEVGDRFPFVNRQHKDTQITVDIDTKPNSSTTLYFKFENEDKLDLTYLLYEKEEYLKDLIFKRNIQSFFFGALIIMLIYNFVFYLFLREKTFGIYILYHTVLFGVMLYYNGVISQYFYPTDYDINGGNVPTVLIYLSIVLGMEFLRHFLNLKEHSPRLNKSLLAFSLVSIILMFIHPFGIIPHQTPSLIMVPLSLFLLFVSAYHAFVLKRKIALFFFFGWLVMLLAIILTGMLSFGLIQRNDFTSYIFQIGIILEITLLSMGLAYRYKLRQDELVEKTKLIYAQSKLAAMGEMLGYISHQWRQPLSEINAIAMRIETDQSNKILNDERLDSHIQKIENTTEYMSQTIDSFNSYFKSDKQLSKVRLEDVLKQTLNLVEEKFSNCDIKISQIINDREYISLVENELVQIILVILNNAYDALLLNNIQNKTITVKIEKHKDMHTIVIEDNAGGIKEENLQKIFKPYFSTKSDSDGIGIGLYMAKMLVIESLKGTLEVSNIKNGTRFEITL